MDIKKVYLPNGRVVTYYCRDGETWNDVAVKDILPYWLDYCYNHWIDFHTYDQIWSFEMKVKTFLDRVGWLIIKDDRGDNLPAAWSEKNYESLVVPMSECPDSISDMFYSNETPPMPSGAVNSQTSRFDMLLDELDEKKNKKYKENKPKTKTTTKFDRLTKIKKKYPDAEMTWCYVDADNDFVYNGKDIHIENCASYAYSMIDGDMASMDQILVVDNNGDLVFYDQNANEVSII